MSEPIPNDFVISGLPSIKIDAEPYPVFWTATPELRWCVHTEEERLDSCSVQRWETRTLQQRWTSSDGESEWRDVPTVTEP